MPFFMLTACGSNPEKTGSNAVQVSSLDSPDIGVVEYRPKTGAGNYSAFRLGGDYANYAATRQFVDRMVDQHGFSRSYLNGLFSKVERQDGVLEILNRPSAKGPARPGSWTRYRNIFMTEQRMREGAEFMTTYRKELNRAYQQYGVPPEVRDVIFKNSFASEGPRAPFEEDDDEEEEGATEEKRGSTTTRRRASRSGPATRG